MTSACRKIIIKLPNRKGGAPVSKDKPVSLRRSRSGSKTFWLTTMTLPVTIWLLLIRYLPMFGIVMSFLDYKLPTRKVPFPLTC